MAAMRRSFLRRTSYLKRLSIILLFFTSPGPDPFDAKKGLTSRPSNSNNFERTIQSKESFEIGNNIHAVSFDFI